RRARVPPRSHLPGARQRDLATSRLRRSRRGADHRRLHRPLPSQTTSHSQLRPVSGGTRALAMNEIKAERFLKRTTSRCPVCHAACPAEVWRVEGRPARVFLRRSCPEHGEASVCIASDARYYWLAHGNPENADACCNAGGASVGANGPSDSSS